MSDMERCPVVQVKHAIAGSSSRTHHSRHCPATHAAGQPAMAHLAGEHVSVLRERPPRQRLRSHDAAQNHRRHACGRHAGGYASWPWVNAPLVQCSVSRERQC